MRFNAGGAPRIISVFATYCGAGDGAVLLCDGSVVAIQMPAKTAISPPTRLSVIGSPTKLSGQQSGGDRVDRHRIRDQRRRRALQRQTQRMKASAPPKTPR